MGTCCVATEQSTMISTVDSGFDSGSSPEIHMEDPPMSRTHQYRKVMKPLLERKRRARINKCLDNLKDLMVDALQSEGESITKLEKADVLELTVRHLQKLKRQNALGLTPEATYAGRFKAGYASCAQEVSKYMTSRNDVSVEATTRLFSHMSNCLQALDSMPPSVLSMAAVPNSPISPLSTNAVPNSPVSPISTSNFTTSTPTGAGTPTTAPISPPSVSTPVSHHNNKFQRHEEQLAPLDLIKICHNKENQVQDLSLKKHRQPLTNINDKWRPW